MELAYRTQSTVTSAISGLGLFVVSRRFLAIPILPGLLLQYCTCVTRAVPLLPIVLASFASFCSEEVNKPANTKIAK